MRRRLNQQPSRKLQFFAKYKALQRGVVAHYVHAKGTSNTCLVCGAKNRPNGHVFSCKTYSFSGHRHFISANNIAVRWWTKDVGSNVPPEWRQMQPQAEVAVPPEKLEVEEQKISVGAGVQFNTGF